jgi:hypothetical protein
LIITIQLTANPCVFVSSIIRHDKPSSYVNNKQHNSNNYNVSNKKRNCGNNKRPFVSSNNGRQLPNKRPCSNKKY